MAEPKRIPKPTAARSSTCDLPKLEVEDLSFQSEQGWKGDASRAVDDGNASTTASVVPNSLDSSASWRLDLNGSHEQTDSSHVMSTKRGDQPSQRADFGGQGHAYVATADAGSSSDSNDDSSSDEDPVTLRRSQTQPEFRPFSTSRLNQVQRRPGTTLTERPERKRRVRVGNAHFTSLGKVARDGRLTVSVNEAANSGYIAKALGATISSHLRPHTQTENEEANKGKVRELQSHGRLAIPRLNIVVMVIGSRGDSKCFSFSPDPFLDSWSSAVF